MKTQVIIIKDIYLPETSIYIQKHGVPRETFYIAAYDLGEWGELIVIWIPLFSVFCFLFIFFVPSLPVGFGYDKNERERIYLYLQ